MRLRDADFNAKLSDFLSYIFTPKAIQAIQARQAKRQKIARDEINRIEEMKRINNEAYDYES